MSLCQNLVTGDKNQSFFENFLMCGKLSTWILKVSGILAKKFGQNLFRKIQSDKFVIGGELELMGIPGLLKGSNE